MFSSGINDPGYRSRWEHSVSQLNFGRSLLQLGLKEQLSLRAHRNHLFCVVALVPRHREEDRVPETERGVRYEAAHALIWDAGVLA